MNTGKKKRDALSMTRMKKVFILDVDGVLIGTTPGINYPEPHPEIIDLLRKIKSNGHHVCLCTGRALFGIHSIIEAANLNDPHITDGGALISNPIEDKTLSIKRIPPQVLNRLLITLSENKIYYEMYTSDTYYVELNSICEKTTKHAQILQSEPQTVKSFSELNGANIIKLFLITDDEAHRRFVDSIIEPFLQDCQLTWGPNPNVLPSQYGWITQSGVSKASAVQAMSDYFGVPLTDFIGGGDNISDWEFIKLCGVGIAMGNSSEELKKQVKTMPNGMGVIVRDVDVNGIIDELQVYA